MSKIELRDAESGRVYTAQLFVDGKCRGYVQKLRRDADYHAHAGGLRIASGRTISELRQEVEAHFRTEG